MTIVWILLAIPGIFLAYLLFGVGFESTRRHSIQNIDRKYKRILSELRDFPDDPELRFEAEAIGRRHFTFLRESQGQTFSQNDEDLIQQDIADAIRGIVHRKTNASKQSQSNPYATLGCLLLPLIGAGLMFLAMSIGKEESNKKRRELREQKRQQNAVAPDDSSNTQLNDTIHESSNQSSFPNVSNN